MKPAPEPGLCGCCHARPARSADAVLCDVCRASADGQITRMQAMVPDVLVRNPPGTTWPPD